MTRRRLWTPSDQHNPNYAEGDCTTCGKHDRFRNSAGQCMDCHNAGYYARKAARKAELAALPRCELCNRRGSWSSAGVLLCGHHLAKVKREWNRRHPDFLSGLLGATPSRSEILTWGRTS